MRIGHGSELERLCFSKAARQGFGDRHNSWAWSMLWWRGHLYVGTNRAWHCAERAGIKSAFPLLVKYPPDDPDVQCTPDPCDLPLQAEIWRWTPGTEQWDRVYQSPQDVPIPKHPGKYVARDTGYRGMAVFTEPDGTEAMYVSGVNSRFAFRPVPPPRLLRSTDGLSFEPVPQDPSTFMGELDKCTLRSLVVHQSRLFVLAGSIRGDGIVIESSHPADGNDGFWQVTPPEMSVFEMISFNGYLYLGLRDPRRGYSVVRTDTTGKPPYAFTSIVTEGAFLPKQPSLSVISMQIYRGRLYVGTDRPGEIIRISPDDTWDLVVGTPRQTPDGYKMPLSGLDAGFSNWLNGHIWRMREHRGRLYIGTWNLSTEFRTAPGAEPMLEPNYGFDLFETADGWHYAPVTTTGFGDKFSCGLRTLVSTPYGLFLGTANKWYGLQIWRGVPETTTSQVAEAPAICPPVESLEIEHDDRRALLSWECPQEAERFRVWRADVTDERRKVESNPLVARILKIARAILVLAPDIYVPGLPDQLWIPGAYAEIGATAEAYYEDKTVMAGKRYAYQVRAENRKGDLSVPSNTVTIPILSPLPTFAGLLDVLRGWMIGNRAQSATLDSVSEEIRKTWASVRLGDAMAAEESLESLLLQLETGFVQTLDPLVADDLQILLTKLRRRVALNRADLIAASVL